MYRHLKDTALPRRVPVPKALNKRGQLLDLPLCAFT
jgi:hypothetical protein